MTKLELFQSSFMMVSKQDAETAFKIRHVDETENMVYYDDIDTGDEHDAYLDELDVEDFYFYKLEQIDTSNVK